MKNWALTIAMCGVAAVSYADEEATKTTDTTGLQLFASNDEIATTDAEPVKETAELQLLASNDEIATTDAEPVKETTELQLLAASEDEIAEAEKKETTELSAWPKGRAIFA